MSNIIRNIRNRCQHHADSPDLSWVVDVLNAFHGHVNDVVFSAFYYAVRTLKQGAEFINVLPIHAKNVGLSALCYHCIDGGRSAQERAQWCRLIVQENFNFHDALHDSSTSIVSPVGNAFINASLLFSTSDQISDYEKIMKHIDPSVVGYALTKLTDSARRPVKTVKLIFMHASHDTLEKSLKSQDICPILIRCAFERNTEMLDVGNALRPIICHKQSIYV